jgi:hypothetical protein
VTHERQLFYLSREARGSQAEVDLLAVQDGRVHPVEVKSAAGGQLRSIRALLQSYPDCGDGLVLYSGAYGERPEQRLGFVPLYYAGTIGPVIPDFDVEMKGEGRRLKGAAGAGEDRRLPLGGPPAALTPRAQPQPPAAPPPPAPRAARSSRAQTSRPARGSSLRRAGPQSSGQSR